VVHDLRTVKNCYAQQHCSMSLRGETQAGCAADTAAAAIVHA
jgi:hypothetical protein